MLPEFLLSIVSLIIIVIILVFIILIFYHVKAQLPLPSVPFLNQNEPPNVKTKIRDFLNKCIKEAEDRKKKLSFFPMGKFTFSNYKAERSHKIEISSNIESLGIITSAKVRTLKCLSHRFKIGDLNWIPHEEDKNPLGKDDQYCIFKMSMKDSSSPPDSIEIKEIIEGISSISLHITDTFILLSPK